MVRPVKNPGNLVIRVCLLLMAGWATLALWCASHLPVVLRNGLAAAIGIGSLVAFARGWGNRRSLLALLAAFAVAIAWWLLLPPSNDRNWQPDVAVLPWAEVKGDKVTVHNIRNCDYRSETDYLVRHYDKTFDLARLKGIDLFLVRWGAPGIAHTMLSFDFGGDGYLCISIEARKEVGEEYSSIKGFFRQYELTYVIADERDLVGLRTQYRGEQVYLYPVITSGDFAREVFLDYLWKVNALHERPEWYGALASNCTTGISARTAPYDPVSHFDWRIILNGHLDQMLYERKAIDTSLPFPELQRRSLINGRAQGKDKSPDFSRSIRAGLPAPPR